MIGWRVAWKCLVAWRFGELSQQPTWPQVRHRRRCTQGEPIFRHSSQPSALGVTSRMSPTWAHVVGHQILLGSARSRRLVAGSARKACSAATTWAPSPTAAATRLIEPARTSPIAKTPARLVSQRRDGRRVGAGAHEALVVERHARFRQPVGVRIGADEQEQMADRRAASPRPTRDGASGSPPARRRCPSSARDLGLASAPRCWAARAMRSTR